MRVNTTLVTLMMITTVLLSPAALAEAQNDGSTQTITNSETWSSDASLDGDVIVSDGGVLTIDGIISVETGSTITIQEGGNLILNSELNSADLTNELFMEVYNGTTIRPYFNGLTDSGTMRINMASEYFSSMEVNFSRRNKHYLDW